MTYSVSKSNKGYQNSKKTKKTGYPNSKRPVLVVRRKKNTSRKITQLNQLQKSYNNIIKERSDMFKGSHIRNLMKIFIKHKRGILKHFPVEIPFFIYAGFKPINLKLVSSITRNPSIFIENTKKSTGKYAKNIHPIDLYYTAIICAMAYQNDTLIGLMISMLGDKAVDGNMIRNILDTLLSGYIGPPLRQNGGADYWKIIKMLIMVANILYLFVEMSHFYSATENLTYDINNGEIVKTVQLLNGISQDVGLFNECMKIQDTNPPLTNVEKIFGNSLNVFGPYKNFLKKANGMIACADDPNLQFLVDQAFAKATQGFDHPLDEQRINPINPMTGLVTTTQPPNLNYSIPLNASAVVNMNNTMPMPIPQSTGQIVNMGTTMDARRQLPPQYSLIEIVNDHNTSIALLNQIQLTHLENGLVKIDEEVQKIAANSTYIEAFRYLDNIVDPTDEKDELAQLLLSNEDFVLYKKDKEAKIAMFKEMTKIQIKDTTYLGYISLVLGALKELVWDYPSHTPFLDIIHEIRNKINLYTRFMRDQYNIVNDNVADSMRELTLFQEKINVANLRLTHILRSSFTLSIQIGYYVIQGLLYLYLLYNKKRRLAIENGPTRRVIENASGPSENVAIEDKKSDSEEINRLTANFNNLRM